MRSLLPFTYFEPDTLPEALAILAREGRGAYPLAGGTDLLVRRKRGDFSARTLVNLKRIAGLNSFEKLPGGARIGALASISEVEQSPEVRSKFPALAEAAGLLGSPSIRNLGTIGGNIGRASPASDIAPVLIALNGQVLVQGVAEEKQYAVERFFRGPGVTQLSPGEVIAGFFIPEMAGSSAAVYERLGRREGMDCALAGVAAYIALEKQDSQAGHARVALASVGPVPLRAKRAEEVLLSGALTEQRMNEAARAAAEDSMPITDMRASAAYRKDLIRVLSLRAFHRTLTLARRRQS